MPLCLTQEELSTWYVDLLVIGGYELVCGYIDVYQKGEYKGTIYLDWFSEHGEMCCMEYYYVSFYGGDICLDSNQYPDVCAPFDLCAPFDEIPGKEVTFDLYSCWTGCSEPDQNFAITPAQSFLSLPSIILLENGNTSSNQVITVTRRNTSHN